MSHVHPTEIFTRQNRKLLRQNEALLNDLDGMSNMANMYAKREHELKNDLNILTSKNKDLRMKQKENLRTIDMLRSSLDVSNNNLRIYMSQKTPRKYEHGSRLQDFSQKLADIPEENKTPSNPLSIDDVLDSLISLENLLTDSKNSIEQKFPEIKKNPSMNYQEVSKILEDILDNTTDNQTSSNNSSTQFQELLDGFGKTQTYPDSIDQVLDSVRGLVSDTQPRI
jgi:hypothetical protein